VNAHQKQSGQVVCLVFVIVAGAAAAQRTTEADVLRQYQKRIDAYMELHSRIERASPPVSTADDPEKIRVSQKAMAAKIRAERPKATQGAIFTPETRTVFRHRIKAELDGPNGADIRRKIDSEAPSPIPLRVSMEYPAGWPLASMPPTILAALPKIPEDLEYRFVGRDLILRDVHANLIIDFIKDAFR
jgi:hypothetical protein